MSLSRDKIIALLSTISTPGGGNLVSDDLIRALTIESGLVRFVIEAPSPDAARALAPAHQAAEAALKALPDVTGVQAVMTAHGPATRPALPRLAAGAEPPSLKIGGHAMPHQGGPARISGIDRIIAVASG